MIITHRRNSLAIENLSGLDAYYKADFGITEGGGVITQWIPYAGGRPVTFNPTTFEPTLNSGGSAGGINGYPTTNIGFAKFFHNSTSSFLRASSAGTVIAVWRHTNNGGDGGAVCGNAFFSLGNIELVPGTTKNVAWEYRPTGSGSPISLSGPVMTIGNIYVAIGRLSMVSGSLRFTLRVNGVDYEGAAPSVATFSDVNSAVRFGYKNWNLDTFDALYGDVAEVAIVERMLDDQQTQRIEEDLRLKYGLSF